MREKLPPGSWTFRVEDTAHHKRPSESGIHMLKNLQAILNGTKFEKSIDCRLVRCQTAKLIMIKFWQSWVIQGGKDHDGRWESEYIF